MLCHSLFSAHLSLHFNSNETTTAILFGLFLFTSHIYIFFRHSSFCISFLPSHYPSSPIPSRVSSSASQTNTDRHCTHASSISEGNKISLCLLVTPNNILVITCSCFINVTRSTFHSEAGKREMCIQGCLFNPIFLPPLRHAARTSITNYSLFCNPPKLFFFFGSAF